MSTMNLLKSDKTTDKKNLPFGESKYVKLINYIIKYKIWFTFFQNPNSLY